MINDNTQPFLFSSHRQDDDPKDLLSRRRNFQFLSPTASPARFPLLLGCLPASKRRSPRLEVTRVVSIGDRDGGFTHPSQLLSGSGYLFCSCCSLGETPCPTALVWIPKGPVEHCISMPCPSRISRQSHHRITIPPIKTYHRQLYNEVSHPSSRYRSYCSLGHASGRTTGTCIYPKG